MKLWVAVKTFFSVAECHPAFHRSKPGTFEVLLVPERLQVVEAKDRLHVLKRVEDVFALGLFDLTCSNGYPAISMHVDQYRQVAASAGMLIHS